MKELILLNNQDFFQVGDHFFFVVTFMFNLVGLDVFMIESWFHLTN